MSVHIKNQQTDEVFDATDILPEYFYISIPLFNDRLEKEIDDWLYVMKHDQVPETFHSPYMKQVSEKLNILKMTEDERVNYSFYQKKLYNDRDELQAAEARGLEKGREEGLEKGLETVAKAMLDESESLEKIARITGLSISQIRHLCS